jgi:DNA repair exonuclease SbcCD ATPase subunit
VIVRSTSATETESHVKRHHELMQSLSEFGHETIESLAKEISKEMQRNSEFERLSDILGNNPSLDELQQKIESLSEGIPAEPPKLPVEALEAQVTELSDSVERIQTQIDGVDEKRRQQEILITAARTQADRLTTERMAIEARVGVYDEERTKAIDENGSMKTRSNHLEDAKKRLAETQRLLDQIEGSEELKRTARVTEHQRLLKNKTRANKELSDLQIDLAQLKSNLEDVFDEDINSKVHDKTEAMRLDTVELQRYVLSVRAKDSLANRLRQKLTEATSIETAPIRDKVQSWLHAVTEGKWTDVRLNERLEVLEIGGPLDTFLPGEHAGSHGLQQVIHALIRLAVATHIYETSSENNPDFPPVTIVMDESQGHVDRDRVSLLMERFNRAIDDGKIQVIALSHRGDEFRSLNPVIEYDMKRREVLDYDLA